MGLSLPEHGYHAINENYDWGQASGGMAMFSGFQELGNFSTVPSPARAVSSRDERRRQSGSRAAHQRDRAQDHRLRGRRARLLSARCSTYSAASGMEYYKCVDEVMANPASMHWTSA